MSAFNWSSNSSQKAFSGRNRPPRLDETVQMLDLKKNDNVTFRIIGPTKTVAEHWFYIRTKAGKVVPLNKKCHAYNVVTGEFDGECPVCKMTGETGKVRAIFNGIIRSEQRMEPKKRPPLLPEEKKLIAPKWAGEGSGTRKYHMKKKGSQAWTPIYVFSMPAGAARDIVNLAKLNTKTNKKTGAVRAYGPDHEKFGFDVSMIYDAKAAPAKRYAISKGEASTLTEEELALPLWDITGPKEESLAEATKDIARLSKQYVPREKQSFGGDGSERSGGMKLPDDDEDADGVEGGEGETAAEANPKKKKKKAREVEKPSKVKSKNKADNKTKPASAVKKKKKK